MKVILINGKKRHGKNTVSEMLLSILPNSIECGNADAVKRIAKDIYTWDGVKDDKGNKLLINVTDTGYNYDPYFWEKLSYSTIREVESIGGELDYVLVYDWRYKSTYDFWADLAMKHDDIEVATINVYRPDFDNGVSEFVKNDKSENMLEGFPFDYKVYNNNSLEGLKDSVKILAENLI